MRFRVRSSNENQNGSSELKHYGVLGMKWGVRKDKETSGKTKRATSSISTDAGGSENKTTSSSNKNSDNSKNGHKITKLETGTILVENLGIKGSTRAYFKDMDQYDRWKNGTLKPGEVAYANGGTSEHTTSGGFGMGKNVSKTDKNTDVEYYLSMGEKPDALVNDIQIYFDNEEDLIEYWNSVFEHYNDVVLDWLEKQGFTQEKADSVTKDPKELRSILDSMNESQKGALNDLLSYALAGSGISPDDFIDQYIESLK